MAQPLAKQPDKELAVPTQEVPLSENLGDLDNWPLEWFYLHSPMPTFLLLCFQSAHDEWTHETPGSPMNPTKGRTPVFCLPVSFSSC